MSCGRQAGAQSQATDPAHTHKPHQSLALAWGEGLGAAPRRERQGLSVTRVSIHLSGGWVGLAAPDVERFFPDLSYIPYCHVGAPQAKKFLDTSGRYVGYVGLGLKKMQSSIKPQHQCQLLNYAIFHDYQLKQAANFANATPCTNRPVQCPKCPAVVWSYSMKQHRLRTRLTTGLCRGSLPSLWGCATTRSKAQSSSSTRSQRQSRWPAEARAASARKRPLSFERFIVSSFERVSEPDVHVPCWLHGWLSSVHTTCDMLMSIAG